MVFHFFRTLDHVSFLQGKIWEILSDSIGEIISQEKDEYKIVDFETILLFMSLTGTTQIFVFDGASTKMNTRPLSLTRGTMR